MEPVEAAHVVGVAPKRVKALASDAPRRLVVIHGSEWPHQAPIPLEPGRRLLVDAKPQFFIDWNAAAGQFELSAPLVGVRLNGAAVARALLSDGDVVGCSETLFVYAERDPSQETKRRAEIIGPSALSLLVLGETGAGKEVLARAVHAASGRRGPFVSVNCGAIPRELFPAELFGHVRGAFSGAVQSRKGWIAASDGGTLLLDEIGDMPLEIQAGVLRVVETKAVAPLGADAEVAVDLRVIAATNRDLRGAVTTGAFRGDLFARLAQFVIEVPPLRQKRTEILSLARQFAKEIDFPLRLETSAAEALVLHPWPYNIRELKSTIAALELFARNAPVASLQHVREVLPEIVGGPRAGGAAVGALGDRSAAEAALQTRQLRPAPVLRDQARLAALLAEADGNVAALARRLGTSRSHVYRWLRRWGLTRS